MKHFVNLIIVIVLICAACFTSCKDDESGDAKVQSVTPTQSSVYILEGTKATLAATVTPNNAGQEVTWTSENPSIATVNGRGRIDGIAASEVTGVALGSTTVTATSVADPGKKATIQVTVITYVDSVTVDTDKITFVSGATETATVVATVMPTNAIQTVVWTSSNSAVATVTDGVIQATGVGSATITATSTVDPTKKATIEVESVSLVNKVIHIASKFGNGLTVNWVNLGGDLVEFFYTNDAGRPTSTIVPVTTQSSYIPDFGSVPLSYRTLYFTGGSIRDTLAAPLIDFTGTVYDLCHYIRSSVDENVVKACDFDIGGEGIGFHDGNSANTSLNYRRDRGDSRSDAIALERATPNIGSISANDWWKYTIDVVDAGNYELDLSLSVNSTTAKCRVEVDGKMSEDYLLNNNASWELWLYYFNFYRIPPPVYNLSAGKHEIKIHVVSTGFNYNGLRLVYKP